MPIGAGATKRGTERSGANSQRVVSGECYALGGGGSGARAIDASWSARPTSTSCSDDATSAKIGSSAVSAFGAQDVIASQSPEDHGNEQSECCDGVSEVSCAGIPGISGIDASDIGMSAMAM